MRFRSPSRQTLAVLDVLAQAGQDWRYGLQLTAQTGLKSGSLYPILTRLHARGWLDERWMEPQRPGRPARHGYRLTAEGRAAWELARASASASPLEVLA